MPVAEQQGMFIAYASAPGRTASDKGDKSGPYAAALAAELGHPGLDHLNLFQNVKETVMATTGGAQQPWESNGLGRRVYLTGQPTPVDVAPPTPQSAGPSRTEIAQFCQSIATNPSQAVVQALADTYKGTQMAVCAEARLKELKLAAAAPPARPATPTKPVQPAMAIAPEPRCDGLEAQVGASFVA